MTMAAAWSGESRLVNLLSNGTSVFLEWRLVDRRPSRFRGAFPTKTINKLRKVLIGAADQGSTGLPRRKESTEVIRKILAVGVAAIVALAIPAAASAKTLIGSGSVAAEPVFLALFHKYEQKHSNIHFVYTADGGNAGVQDVQAEKSMFAGQPRLPLPRTSRTTYINMYLDEDSAST